MHVGVLEVRFDTPFARSLKQKRSLVKPVVERVRQRYDVSVARIDGLDAHDWERIAIAAVSADPGLLRELLERIYAFVVGQGVPVDHHEIAVHIWDPLT